MVQIIPTILVKTFDEFQQTVKLIENHFDIAQVDVMDGKFVPNTTFADFEKIAKVETPLKYELHLMVQEPISYLQQSVMSHKEFFHQKIHRILFHYESTKKINETITFIKGLNIQVGLVINPETSVDSVKGFLGILDLVMVMGVKPGFSGQKFIPKTFDTVKALRKLNSVVDISVDGGVDDTSSTKLIEAGATVLSANTFLYKGDVVKQSKKLL